MLVGRLATCELVIDRAARVLLVCAAVVGFLGRRCAVWPQHDLCCHRAARDWDGRDGGACHRVYPRGTGARVCCTHMSKFDAATCRCQAVPRTTDRGGENAWLCVTRAFLCRLFCPLSHTKAPAGNTCAPVILSHTKAPAGAIHITAECENGKAKNITFRNTPSFVGKLGVEVDVPGGVGKVSVDIAYGKCPPLDTHLVAACQAAAGPRMLCGKMVILGSRALARYPSLSPAILAWRLRLDSRLRLCAVCFADIHHRFDQIRSMKNCNFPL